MSKRFNCSNREIHNQNTNITYYIGREIGKGSFSNVFNIIYSKTKDNNNISQEPRCVKIFKNESIYSKCADKEFTILIKLNNSKNFIKCFDTFLYLNHKCLIFKRYAINLYQFYKRLETLKKYQLNFIIKSILTGLDKIKENHIIHADLKPENILLNYDTSYNVTECVICDFNSSFDLTKTLPNQTNKNIVSSWYRAPEIYLDNIKYSYEIDMWSFGLILYEIITSKTLFYIKATGNYNIDNTELFNLHYGFLGETTITKELPQENMKTHIHSSLFKSGFQTLFSETVKWDPAKRYTPKRALEYFAFICELEQEHEKLIREQSQELMYET